MQNTWSWLGQPPWQQLEVPPLSRGTSWQVPACPSAQKEATWSGLLSSPFPKFPCKTLTKSRFHSQPLDSSRFRQSWKVILILKGASESSGKLINTSEFHLQSFWFSMPGWGPAVSWKWLNNRLSEEKNKHWSKVSANFHSVNIPTMADFKPPIWLSLDVELGRWYEQSPAHPWHWDLRICVSNKIQVLLSCGSQSGSYTKSHCARRLSQRVWILGRGSWIVPMTLQPWS